MFTQKRSGKLHRRGKVMVKAVRVHRGATEAAAICNLLVFQMCSVSGSVMPRLSACSSRKSKKYLTASGGQSGGMLRMA